RRPRGTGGASAITGSRDAADSTAGRDPPLLLFRRAEAPARLAGPETCGRDTPLKGVSCPQVERRRRGTPGQAARRRWRSDGGGRRRAGSVAMPSPTRQGSAWPTPTAAHTAASTVSSTVIVIFVVLTTSPPNINMARVGSRGVHVSAVLTL